MSITLPPIPNWHAGVDYEYKNNLMNTPSAVANNSLTPASFGTPSSGFSFPWSSIASGAGSAVGGLFGFLGQRSANKAMLKATRETNAQNYKIWQEQQNHNRELYGLQHRNNIELWNMQNEYNDPSNQMERLRNAGLNPYMAISGNNPTGVATNSPASATAQPAQTPTMQAPPPQAFQSPLLSGIQSFISNIGAFSQLSDTNINNQMLPFQKEYSKFLSRNTAQTNKLMKLQERYDASTLQFRVQQQELQNDALFVQTMGMRLSNQTQQVILSYLDQNQAVDYLIKCRQASLLHLQGKLTKEQYYNAIKTGLLINEQSKTEKSKQKANNASANLANEQAKTIDETRPYVVDKTKNESIVALETGIKLGNENYLFDQTVENIAKATNKYNELNFNWYGQESRMLLNQPEYFWRARYKLLSNGKIDFGVPGYFGVGWDTHF